MQWESGVVCVVGLSASWLLSCLYACIASPVFASAAASSVKSVYLRSLCHIFSAALAALCRWPRQPLTCARCWRAACATTSPARPRWALVVAFTFCEGPGSVVAALHAACDCCLGRRVCWGDAACRSCLASLSLLSACPAVGDPLQFCLRLPQMMVPPLLERFKEKNIVMSKVCC